MNHTDPTSSSLESFERLLFVGSVAIIATTAAWLSQAYPPDRWLIGSWVSLITAVAFVFASQLVSPFWPTGVRARRWLSLAAAISFLIGLAFATVFLSEQGLDEDQRESFARLERFD